MKEQVIRNRWYLCVGIIFVFICVAGCDKIQLPIPGFNKPAATVRTPADVAPEVSGTVIAKVYDISLTLEDLNQEIESYNAMVPEDKPELKITTRDQKLDYLKTEMVRRALLYHQAMMQGLDRNIDVRRALQKTKEDLLVLELVKEEAAKAEVLSKEIEDYYNMYKDQLKEPEERRLREIVVPTEAEANEILIALLQGGDFATIAKERSKSPTAAAGGDLGFIKLGVKSPQFDAVAFSNTLDVGKLSNIFKVPEGYAIVKLEAKRGGKEKPLSEMWDDLKRGLTFLKQQQRIEELISGLSSKAKIEIYEKEIQ